MTVSGPGLFGRFAYPPNALGYCGPDDARGLLEQVVDGRADDDMRAAARRFEGAWPYLRLIATANGIADPLDGRVVEAYWIGNALLDRVDARLLGDSLDDRFRRRVGLAWGELVAAVLGGARPHHNFHVFAVYPWLGLIRSGVVDEPLRVLDRCRIRWGRVEDSYGDTAIVRTRLITWNGRALGLGPPQSEEVRLAADGLGLASSPRPGDWCALHWDWVCAPLVERQRRELVHRTLHTLAVVNGQRRPAPAAVLG